MADERSGALSIGGGLGSLARHLGGLRRDPGDYEIPNGVLPNSSLESSNLTGGLSLVGESGYLGFAVSGYDNDYGIPGPDQEVCRSESTWTSAGSTSRASWTVPWRSSRASGWRRRIARSGVSEGRSAFRSLAATSPPSARFVPPTETDAWALFAFEELDLGRLRLQFGSRFERGEVAATVDDLPASPSTPFPPRVA